MTGVSKHCRYAKGCDRAVVSEGLCILHMPKNGSGQDAELEARFDAEFQRILDECEADPLIESCSLGGVHFPKLHLEGRRVRIRLEFDDARCAGPVTIRDCRFAGGFSFRRSIFEGEVRIESSEVGNRSGSDLLLRESIFRGDVTLQELSVSQLSASDAVFEKRLIATRCAFLGDASFTHATFSADVRFDQCTFVNRVSFRRARFAGCVDFEHDAGRGGQRMFDDELDFAYVTQSDRTRICFAEVDLSLATFLATDLETIRFRNVRWNEIDGRAALCDEVLLRQDDRRVWPFAFIQPGRHTSYGRVNENYRQLVLNYEKRREYSVAEDFHIGELETARRSRVLPLAYGLYSFLSIYGTSYVRALMVLVLTFLILASLFLLAGFRLVAEGTFVAYDIAPDGSWPPASALARDFREACLLVLSTVTVSRYRLYEPVSWEGRLLLPVTVIALASQLALFLLALRRRFKR